MYTVIVPFEIELHFMKEQIDCLFQYFFFIFFINVVFIYFAGLPILLIRCNSAPR